MRTEILEGGNSWSATTRGSPTSSFGPVRRLGDLGAGEPERRDPDARLDGLAEHGIRFDNFFSTSPVCSPARESLLTGQIPSRHGVHDWVRDGNEGPSAVDYLLGRRTYVDVLAEAGWRCGLVGRGEAFSRLPEGEPTWLPRCR